MVAHPAIAARSIQVNVGAQIAEHQRLPQISGAEVGHHEIQLGMQQSQWVQLDRIGIAHVEGRTQPQFVANAHRQDAAMHEDHDTRAGGSCLQDRLDSMIVHRVAMHGGKKADALKPGRQGAVHALERIRSERIHHEIPVKPGGKSGHRLGHRRFIARNTRDQGRAGNAVAVQSPGPDFS